MHNELKLLLEERLAIIGDHTLREKDPAAHLDALKTISEKISEYTHNHQADFDSKLRHYLSNFSYQKALEHIS